MAFSPFVSALFAGLPPPSLGSALAWNITADCMASDKVSLVSFFRAIVKVHGDNHHETTHLVLKHPVNPLIISAMRVVLSSPQLFFVLFQFVAALGQNLLKSLLTPLLRRRQCFT